MVGATKRPGRGRNIDRAWTSSPSPHSQPGPSALDARPHPSSPSNATTRNLVPIEGVVVQHPPSRMPEATVVHDSETIIASDGVGPRLFDPATKSSVRIDRNGNVIDEGGEQ